MFFSNLAVVAECISGQKTALSGECMYYNLCVNGLFIAHRCPRKSSNGSAQWATEHQMFDPSLNECVDKQKVAVAGNCNAYQECRLMSSVSHIDKWVESECAGGEHFHFEPQAQKCVDSSISTCGKFKLVLQFEEEWRWLTACVFI